VSIKTFRRLFIEWNGKVVILSDIHYPNCNINEINEILIRENPSLIVLLGDIITERETDYRIFINKLKIKRNIIYIRGDEDKVKGDTDVLKLRNNNKTYLLLHGHQYFDEKYEFRIARFLKKINRNLPPLLFCLAFKVLLRDFKDYIILGHSHALVNFKNIMCVNAGTMSTISNLYNDRGYVVISNKGIKINKLS